MTEQSPIRQQLNAELDRLAPEQLAQLLQLARQLRDTEDSGDGTCREAWLEWFAQVDRLEYSPNNNAPSTTSEYSDLLVEKYRDRGLEL